MKLKFGILRLVLAATGFATPFLIFNSKGALAFWIVFFVGSALALIALAVEAKQVWLLVRTAFFAAIGTAMGLMCCPMIDPPYERGDEFGYMILGCMIGCLAGISWTATRNPLVDTEILPNVKLRNPIQ